MTTTELNCPACGEMIELQVSTEDPKKGCCGSCGADWSISDEGKIIDPEAGSNMVPTLGQRFAASFIAQAAESRASKKVAESSAASPIQIHDLLGSQRFYDWYGDDGAWGKYIQGAAGAPSKEDILAQIAAMFGVSNTRSESLTVVVEDWGNLKGVIDPKLLDFHVGYMGRKPNTPAGLGADSQYTVEPVKSAASLLRLFDDATVVGVVLAIDGEQVAAAWRHDSSGNYIIKTASSDLGQFATNHAKAGGLYSLLTAVKKMAGGVKDAVEVYVVKKDTVKKDKQITRLAQKKGHRDFKHVNRGPARFVSPSSSEFAAAAKSELNSRLAKFKGDKAKSGGSMDPAGMADEIADKGFLETISVNGYVYRRKDNSLYISNIGGAPSHFSGPNRGASIEYEYDDSKNETNFYGIKDRSARPPRSFYVMLKLDKGTIVVDKVVAEDDDAPNRVKDVSTRKPKEPAPDAASVESAAAKMVNRVLEMARRKTGKVNENGANYELLQIVDDMVYKYSKPGAWYETDEFEMARDALMAALPEHGQTVQALADLASTSANAFEAGEPADYSGQLIAAGRRVSDLLA